MFLSTTRGNNIISILHPAVKIFLFITTVVFVFFVSNLLFLSMYLAAVLLIVKYFKISFGQALFIIKLFLLGTPVLIGIFILSYLWKQPTYIEGIIMGIREGTAYILRFLNVIIINFMIISCTDSREILSTLTVLRIPQPIPQIITHIINFLPRLSQEMKLIVEAQTLRGMQWKSLWNPSNWMPVSLPIILSAMRYSEQMAISQELRGGAENRVYKSPRFGIYDWSVSIICIIIIVLSVMQYQINPAF